MRVRVPLRVLSVLALSLPIAALLTFGFATAEASA